MENSTPVPAFDGQRLRTLRQQRRWSAEKLARRADVSLRHVWRLEANERPNVSAIVVARLAQALNVNVEYLLSLTDNSDANTHDAANPHC